MTPEVLPAMLSLRKLRHREYDVPGLFFPYDRDLIIQVKTIPDSKYSASWRGWYLPYTETNLPSVQKLGKLESFSLDCLALLSGTIAASPAPDDPTGILSQKKNWIKKVTLIKKLTLMINSLIEGNDHKSSHP